MPPGPVHAGPGAGIEAMSEKDSSRARRSVLLFWVHLALAVLVVAGFVYSVAHK